MVSWPDLGTRVSVRYRRPAGSVPPLTDAVGQLLSIDPSVRVRTKSGAVVEFAAADVTALRTLTDAPVRASQIRGLEHAAALAWPGIEQAWLDGWLLRAARGVSLAANSAVPLGVSAHMNTIPAIVDWYGRRGLIPRLAIPDRLMRLPGGRPAERAERILVRNVVTAEPDRSVTLAAHPDDSWLRSHGHAIPVDVLTAVADGELTFGSHPGGAVARAAVTQAPNGARWVGLSAIRAPDPAAALAVCEALLAWGASRGATVAYLHARQDDLAEALGFRPHHRRNYVRVMSGQIGETHA